MHLFMMRCIRTFVAESDTVLIKEKAQCQSGHECLANCCLEGASFGNWSGSALSKRRRCPDRNSGMTGPGEVG